MTRKKVLLTLSASALLVGVLFAADHIDSPTVTNQSTDITDLYVFRGADQNNMVFVANTQGLLAPGATGAAKFDENTLIEFNIDNNNDNVEDLVIQGLYSGGKMQVYGPIKPSEIGTRSKTEGSIAVEVALTPYGSAVTIGS